MVNKEKVLKYALLFLIASTLLFIFIQSMLPPETSSAESEAVGGVIEEIIPPDTKPGAFIQTNLRKIAHFTEFFFLGIELALYIAFFMKRGIFVLLSYPFSMLIAFFDESIQVLSGRGPSITDAWIDFFGFFVSASIVYAIFFTAKYLIMRKKTRNVTE